MNLPNVKIPIADAIRKLRSQISEGNDLLEQSVNSTQTFQRAVAKRDRWTAENISLLLLIFDDDSPAKTFGSRFNKEFASSEETEEEIQFFFDEIRMQIRDLNLILETISATASDQTPNDKTQTLQVSSIAPAKDVAESHSSQAPLTFVIRVSNPVVIQVATGILVVLVGAMWALFNAFYQDKKESLKERYEAEMSIVKSKCEQKDIEAQSRIKALEEEISKQAHVPTGQPPK